MKDLKKIEFFITKEKCKELDKITDRENFTYAELMRRAMDLYLETYQNKLIAKKPI